MARKKQSQSEKRLEAIEKHVAKLEHCMVEQHGLLEAATAARANSISAVVEAEALAAAAALEVDRAAALVTGVESEIFKAASARIAGGILDRSVLDAPYSISDLDTASNRCHAALSRQKKAACEVGHAEQAVSLVEQEEQRIGQNLEKLSAKCGKLESERVELELRLTEEAE